MDRGTAGTPIERKPVSELDNNALIIRLLYTVNHLSRWLSPVHDESRLQRSPVRDERSPKDIVVAFRDDELAVFPKVHAIAVQNRPNLDRLPPVFRSEADQAWDRQAATFEVMGEFRRLRQSTGSLLRSLPDAAWQRDGLSRQEHDWTIRALAEHLANNDVRLLAELDQALERSGARENIADVSRTRLPELLRLAP
jgi:hypothetical protein